MNKSLLGFTCSLCLLSLPAVVSAAKPIAESQAANPAAPLWVLKGVDKASQNPQELQLWPGEQAGAYTGTLKDLRTTETIKVSISLSESNLVITGVDWVGKKPWINFGHPSKYKAELRRQADGTFAGEFKWGSGAGDLTFQAPPSLALPGALPAPKEETGLVGALQTVNRNIDSLNQALEPGQTAPPNASAEAAPAAPGADSFGRFSTEAYGRFDLAELKQVAWVNSPESHSMRKLGAPLEGRVEGAAGLVWGATPETVTQELQKRGATFQGKSAEAGRTALTFGGGSFGGQTVNVWKASFVGTELFELSIQFYYPTGDTMKGFRQIQASLVGKYGTPNKIQDHRYSRIDLDADYSPQAHDHYGADGAYWRALYSLQSLYIKGVANNVVQPVSLWQYANEDKISLHAIDHSDVLLVYSHGAGSKKTAVLNQAEAAKDF